MKKFLLLFVFVLFLVYGFTFTANDIDSLLVVVNNSTGEAKVESLLVLSQEVFESSPELSAAYVNQAVTEIEENIMEEKKADVYIFLAEIFNQRSLHDSSIRYYKLAEKYASTFANFKTLTKINNNLGQIYEMESDFNLTEKHYIKALNYALLANDSLQEVNLLINLGYLYDMKGRRDTAISCLEDAINSSEKSDFKIGIARASIAMGNLYHGMGNMENALEYYNRSLEIAKDLNSIMGIGISLTNLASVYNTIGNHSMAMKLTLEAIKYLNTTKEYGLLANSYSNLANIQSDSGMFKQSYINLSKSLKLFRKYGNKEEIAISMFAHSNVYGQAGKYHISNAYLDTTLNIAVKIDFALMQQKVYQAYAKNYSSLGNFEKALKSNEIYLTIKDSLENEKMQNQLLDFEVKYNTLRKEKEIEVLQKDKELNEALLSEKKIERNAYLGAFVFVSFLILILVQKRKREKQINLHKLHLSEQNQRITKIELEKSRLQKEELELELDFTSKQLTSHALNMMQKSRLFKSLEKDLDMLKKIPDTEKNQQITSIKRQISRNLRGEKDWELFKMYFEKVNKGFYVKLKDDYPELTTAELKLCALVKLNFNIKETAAILNLSPETIKSSRYRLRKKLELNPEDDLSAIIQNI